MRTFTGPAVLGRRENVLGKPPWHVPKRLDKDCLNTHTLIFCTKYNPQVNVHRRTFNEHKYQQTHEKYSTPLTYFIYIHKKVFLLYVLRGRLKSSQKPREAKNIQLGGRGGGGGFAKSRWSENGPFAQLLPGLETGHPVTVGQSPAHESHSEQSETETRKTAFCFSSETLKSYAGDWPTVTVAPSQTQAIIVQMVY